MTVQRFYTISACGERTWDGRTNRRNCYINIARALIN